MKRKIFIVAVSLGIVSLFAFKYSRKPVNDTVKFISRQEVFKNKLSAQCSPDWNYLNSDSLVPGISILQGWGDYQWPIASASDSARRYFQQGINMYYSFHIIEAMASFKKAAQFDSTNAMIFWGQALAYGPNINDFGYASTPDAYAAAQKAISFSGGCGAKEKSLITAMGMRYTLDSAISRESLNQLYTGEMQKSYSRFPNDPDVAALYADAMMLLHPWNLWKHNGDAQPWTPRLLEVLEKALQRSPGHPGANHYYIHCVEASSNPQRAMPSADRLSKLMPMVSHMVHMPSHIYIRSGFYEKGMKVNELAIKGYQDYLSLYPDVINNAPLYLIHNLHMQAACAMMGAGYNLSAKSAADTRGSFDTSFLSAPSPFGDFVQYVYMTPVFNDVRFGKWEDILKAPAISENHVYANVLLHWAKGIAHARTNNIAMAKEELEYVRKKKDQPGMLVVMQPFNKPADAAGVAEKLLEGIIAEQENDLPNAISAFTAAVKNEDAMIYNEPKDWILPTRPYLGAALIKAGFFSKAETTFRQDLRINPHNHWSLKGLHECLQKQRKNTAAKLIKKQLDQSGTMGDMKDFPIVF